MPQLGSRTRLTLVYAAVAATSVPQTPIRWATRNEIVEIQKAVHRLVSAANSRDLPGVQANTTPLFDASGEGRHLTATGVSQFSAVKGEDLSAVQLATLIRHARLVSGEVAVGDGFFRTDGLPGGELSGDLAITLVKRDDVWLVATARFAAIHSSPTISPVRISNVNAAPGKDGWVNLFDGKSADAFVDPLGEALSNSWVVREGLLTNSPANKASSRGLLTKDTYTSFEMEFDWKVASKGNSGVKYRLFYLIGGDAAGHEYQLADDAGDPGAIRRSTERSGALYNLISPAKTVVKPAGEFNRSVLIVRGRHCEHWLNGEKVVEYDTESGAIRSPLLLQNHGTDVWFRKIRVRRL